MMNSFYIAWKYICFNKAKTIDTTKRRALIVESNLASVYKAQKKYNKALEINKRTLKLVDPKDYAQMGVRYGNLASTYGLLKDWDKDSLEFAKPRKSTSRSLNFSFRS